MGYNLAIVGATGAVGREMLQTLSERNYPVNNIYDHVIFAHQSAEAGHEKLMNKLGKVPMLNLGMRLGEGSGAALALSIIRSSLDCHIDMATFAEAGISG